MQGRDRILANQMIRIEARYSCVSKSIRPGSRLFERGCIAEGSRTCLGRPPGPRENILRTVTSTWSAILPFFCHPVQQEGAKAAVVMASTIITTRMRRMGQALLAFISFSLQNNFGAVPLEHTRAQISRTTRSAKKYGR